MFCVSKRFYMGNSNIWTNFTVDKNVYYVWTRWFGAEVNQTVTVSSSNFWSNYDWIIEAIQSSHFNAYFIYIIPSII